MEVIRLVLLWVLLIANPLHSLYLYYKSTSMTEMIFRKAFVDLFCYAYTFALLYLIAGPPEPNPLRSTTVWKFVVMWALLVCLKFCELNFLHQHNTFEFFYLVSDQLFNYDFVFLRKIAIRGHFMYLKCMDDLMELFTLFAFPPRLGKRVGSKWELVGACRSSNRGFNVRQFYQVTVCPVNIPIDDPFRPDHLSTLHMVEVRRRNPVWYTIVIWRMSLINNGQWKLHEFDFNFKYDIDQQHELLAMFAGDPRCFEPNGVIFVCLLNRICIYDTRLDVAMDYNATEFGRARAKGMVMCIGRIWKTKQSNFGGIWKRNLVGWKVRVIGGYRDQ